MFGLNLFGHARQDAALAGYMYPWAIVAIEGVIQVILLAITACMMHHIKDLYEINAGLSQDIIALNSVDKDFRSQISVLNDGEVDLNNRVNSIDIDITSINLDITNIDGNMTAIDESITAIETKDAEQDKELKELESSIGDQSIE